MIDSQEDDENDLNQSKENSLSEPQHSLQLFEITDPEHNTFFTNQIDTKLDSQSTYSNDDNILLKRGSTADDSEPRDSIIESRKRVGKYIFTDREPLAKHGESKIYLATNQETREQVIVRCIDKSRISKHLNEKFQQELKNIMKGQEFYKEYVVKIIDIFQTSMNFYIVQQYIKEGNIGNIQRNEIAQMTDGIEREQRIIGILQQLVKTIQKVIEIKQKFLKYNVTSIGCLKIQNIFIQENGCLKLSDFSTHYQNIKSELNTKKIMENINDDDVIMMGVIAFQLFYGENASVFTRHEGSLERFIQRQNVKMDNELQEFVHNCVFKQKIGYTWQNVLDKLEQLSEESQIKSSQLLNYQQPQYKNTKAFDRFKRTSFQIIQTQKVQKLLGLGVKKKQSQGENRVVDEEEDEDNEEEENLDQSGLILDSNEGKLNNNIEDNKQTQQIQRKDNRKKTGLNALKKKSRLLGEGEQNPQQFFQSMIKQNTDLMKQFGFQPQQQLQKVERRDSFVGQLVIEDSQELLKRKMQKQLSNTKSQIKIRKTFTSYSHIYSQDKITLFGKYEIETKVYKKTKFYNGKENKTFSTDIPIFDHIEDNQKYTFEVTEEIDNQSYIIPQDEFNYEEPSFAEGNYQIYEQLVKKKKSFFKAIDLKSDKIFVIKSVTPDDDIEFGKILREIAMLKYIELNIQDSKHINLDESQNNLDKQSDRENLSKISNRYIGKLFEKLIQQNSGTKGKIEKIYDVFICKNNSQLTFFIVYESFDYTLKDYLVRNSSSNQLCKDDQNQLIFLFGYYLGNFVQQLKEIGICHNYIAPENIYLQKNGEYYNIVLGNFECAITKKQSFSAMYIQYSKQMDGIKYKSPEITNTLKLAEFDSELIKCSPIKSDSYAIGIILAEVMEKRIIEKHLTHKITEKMGFEVESQEIIIMLLNKDINYRIKPKKLIEMCKSNLKSENFQEKTFIKYEKYSMQRMGDINASIGMLVLSKCCRIVQDVAQCQELLGILKNKYLKSKSKIQDVHTINILLLTEIAHYYRDTGDSEQSIKSYLEAINLMKNLEYGTLIDQANLYLEAAILQENSVNWFKISLTIMRKTLETGNPKMVRNMVAYGEACEMKKDLLEALHIYQEATIVFKNSIGFKGPLGLKLLDKVGTIYFQISEYSNAQQFFEKSLKIKNVVFYKDHFTIIETMNNCAECYRMLGNYNQAEQLYEKALRRLQKRKNETIELRSQIYNNMGICLKLQGKIRQACLLYEESYRLKKILYGESHFATLQTLLNIGALQDEKGCHTKGIQFFDEIISNLKEENNVEHPLYAEALQNKGIALFNLAHYSKSATLLNEALNLKRKLHGNMHVSVGNTLQNLALVMHRQGQYKKALSIFDEALKIYLKKLGSNHSYVKQVQENYQHTLKFNSQ